jgi:hypothetical protein
MPVFESYIDIVQLSVCAFAMVFQDIKYIPIFLKHNV